MGRETRGPSGRFTGSVGSGKNRIPQRDRRLISTPEHSPLIPIAENSHLDEVYARFTSRSNQDKPLSHPPEPAEVIDADAHFLAYHQWATENGLNDLADPLEISINIFGPAEGAKTNQHDRLAFVASSPEGRIGSKFTTRADWDPEQNGYVITREWLGRRNIWQRKEIGFTENAREAFHLVRLDAAYGVQRG